MEKKINKIGRVNWKESVGNRMIFENTLNGIKDEEKKKKDRF